MPPTAKAGGLLPLTKEVVGQIITKDGECPVFKLVYHPLRKPSFEHLWVGDTPQAREIVEDNLRRFPSGERHHYQHRDGCYYEHREGEHGRIRGL